MGQTDTLQTDGRMPDVVLTLRLPLDAPSVIIISTDPLHVHFALFAYHVSRLRPVLSPVQR